MRHRTLSNNGFALRTLSALLAGAALCALSPTSAGADDPPAASAAPQVLESTTTSKPAVDLPDTTKAKPTPSWITDAPTAPAASPAPQAGSSLTIATDRPGFGDTTTIAPVGHLQLELGYTYTFRDRDGVESQTHNAPEILARVGLITDRLELRVSTSGYVWSRSDDGSGSGFVSSEGFSDISVGARLKLTDQSGLFPRLALGASTTIGVGSRAVSNRDLEPTVRMIGSWDLGCCFSLTANAGVTYASSGGQRFTQGFGSASLGYAVNDRLSLFFEYFVVGPRTKGADAAHSIDFGGALLLNKRIQLDARMGIGLNQEADNLFAGTGLSVLF